MTKDETWGQVRDLTTTIAPRLMQALAAYMLLRHSHLVLGISPFGVSGWVNCCDCVNLDEDSGVEVIVIRCARCKSKVFKYVKVGKGRILHCWRDRIAEDYSVRDGNEVKCRCGNLIGIDERTWVKMKRHSFIYSGTIRKR